VGYTQEAIAEFQAAAKIAPEEPNVYFGIGYLYWESDKYDEATSAFEEELRIDPGNAQALTYLGDMAMRKDEPDQALALLNKAVQLRSDIRLAYLDIAAIQVDKKNYTEALAALRHAEKLDPEQPDAHFRMGRVYQLLGNMAAAQKEFALVRDLKKKKEDASVASKMPNPSAPSPP